MWNLTMQLYSFLHAIHMDLQETVDCLVEINTRQLCQDYKQTSPIDCLLVTPYVYIVNYLCLFHSTTVELSILVYYKCQFVLINHRT